MNNSRDRKIVSNDILIVDDETANIKLLETTLMGAGYSVRLASSGTLALRSVRAKHPALILLDIRMPEMDGYEVCRQLKSDPETDKIPVIFLSFLEDLKDKVKAFQVGGIDYITKPFDTEEVLARVNTHLTLSRVQSELAQRNVELAEASDQLEEKVKIRTKELADLNGELNKEIANHKATMAELALALQRLKSHVENSPLAFVEFDHSFKIIGWSKRAEQVFGWIADEVIGKSIDELKWVYDEDRGKVASLSQDMLNSKRTSNIHVNRNYRKDGSVIDCEWYNSALHDADKNLISIQSMVMDITDRLRAEEALQASEKRLKAAEEVGHIGYFEVDITTGIALWSEETFRIFGLTPGTQSPTIETYLKLIHPDDLQKVTQMHNECVNNGKTFDLIYQIFHTSGETRYVHSISSVIHDSHGREKMFGTIQDITEQVLIENRLKKALQERETLIQEVYHRTKNNLLTIGMLLSLQSELVKDQEIKTQFSIAINRIESMAKAQEKLYRSDDLIHLKLADYFMDLGSSLFNNYKLKSGKADMSYDMDRTVIATSKNAIPCGLILNELITNAMKYAFPGDRSGEITIFLRKTETEDIEFGVKDNGVGLPANFDLDQTESFGLQLIQILTGQLKGKLTYNGENGTEWRIRFPAEDIKRLP